MRELNVAYGKRRNSYIWNNRKMAWPDLVNCFRETKRTSESVREYHDLSREKRDTIKDGPGFVAGELKDGRRTGDHVISRSAIVLDGDKVPSGFIANYQARYAGFLYTTHSHTPESPRIRMVFPLTRDVDRDEFMAIARFLADEHGIEYFDECSYRANQLMYLPSTPSDGEYIFMEFDQDWLDPDAYLALHPNWKDCSTLPHSTREKEVRQQTGMKAGDPKLKSGIVGDFCRTYSVPEAINTFLSDVYSESDISNRYTYIHGESTSGLIVYNDGDFAFSHHATDPACGKNLNAFDLVRIHRYGALDDSYPDDTPVSTLPSTRAMANFAASDEKVKEQKAQADFAHITPVGWDEPIQFNTSVAQPFPVDALPPVYRDYVCAIAESTQTPVDMGGATALGIMAACMQGKYHVRAKADWKEPVNLYVLVILEPSERKSAVLRTMVEPINKYEREYNKIHSAEYESSRARKRILEKRQRTLEDAVVKGKAEPDELDKVNEEIAHFEEVKPLKLVADDVTSEKLASLMCQHQGRMSIISSEGGIFDTMAGRYNNKSNIEVYLKAHSEDAICVDRVKDDEGIVIENPALTIVLTVQPKTIENLLNNEEFRGRGLVSRFLFSCPKSLIGERDINSLPVEKELYERYEKAVYDLLQDNSHEEITVLPEAFRLVADFATELEPKIRREYGEISDWVGKLVGHIIRFAGLLARANVTRTEFLNINDPIVVDKKTMANAIRLGQYFLSHTESVFSIIPENSMIIKANTILNMLVNTNLTSFNRRIAMRNCRSFKTTDEIQPVLDFLEDYGYIKLDEHAAALSRGRRAVNTYLVHPDLKCHTVLKVS